MKKYFVILSLSLLIPSFVSSQTTDQLVTKCAMSAGPNTTYLKDFRVQLGKGNLQTELRYKEVFPLSKNMKYKFTLCNAENSGSELIMTLKDNTGKTVLSSFDQKTGKAFASIEFTCSKTGTYQLYFDFMNFQQGLGIGVVSLVR